MATTIIFVDETGCYKDVFANSLLTASKERVLSTCQACVQIYWG